MAWKRFILNASSVAELVVPKIERHSETMAGEIQFIEDNRYDVVKGRLETNYTFVRGRMTEKEFGSHRIYRYSELLQLIAEAGFYICVSFGSVDHEPLTTNSRGLNIVAKKE